MAQALLQRMNQGGVVAIEAPTGIGKTLAYLVAAMLSDRRVVISTHTKTLQDQIVDKDLTLLARLAQAMGRRLERATPDAPPADAEVVRTALMKGRSNYLCLARLDRHTAQRSFSFEEDDVFGQIRAWSQTTERGDRAELRVLNESDPRWFDVDARSEVCIGTKCPRYDACFVVRMRREAQRADIIIVNHHLLMSDLALRAQSRLSGDGRIHFEIVPEVDSLILDEAHGLEAVASDYFGGTVSRRMVERLTKDVTDFVAAAPETPAALGMSATQSGAAASDLFRSVPRSPGRARISRNAPEFEDARRRLESVEAHFERLAATLEEFQSGDLNAAHLARRARGLAESFRFVLRAEDPDFVYWSEVQSRNVALGASPIEVSNLLRLYLFERFHSVGLCSATLSTGGDMSYFLSSTGTPRDADAHVFTSPYDYRRQAALFVPRDAPDPDSVNAAEKVVSASRALIELVGGGALLLFTSVRSMNQAFKTLRGSLSFPCYVQGELPKRELIARFVDRAPAVLCATASFWEGVDIPGDPLRLVVIDRLPFESPADPLVAARAERARSRGENPFTHLHLPRAILRLKQGFGRLVRSRTDRGIVAVLDGRISDRSYGARFVEALPDVPCFRALDDLRAWWDRSAGDGPLDRHSEPTS
ncbi:MAG: ATP-dependent DNA helicase [Myxococcota bacterium]